METQGQEEVEAKPRLIKRYANRKLYDTRDSRYVTLQQIAVFVRDGEDVTIIDNKSKEDLTNVTLAQIIYEEEKRVADEGRESSKGTLRGFIQNGGERLFSTLREGPVGKLIARKEGDEGELEETQPDLEAGGDEKPRRSVLQSSKEALDEIQRLADDQLKGLLGHAITRVQTLQQEVGRLQSRIEVLEERLIELSGKAPADEQTTESDG